MNDSGGTMSLICQISACNAYSILAEKMFTFTTMATPSFPARWLDCESKLAPARTYIGRVGIWIPSVTLSTDERVGYRAGGNLFSGRRQIGVLVIVTDRRLLIVPNRLDSLLGGRRIELPRDVITGMRTEPADSPVARTRGLSARFRPQVEIRSGEQLWAMTVFHPERLVRALETGRPGDRT